MLVSSQQALTKLAGIRQFSFTILQNLISSTNIGPKKTFIPLRWNEAFKWNILSNLTNILDIPLVCSPLHMITHNDL
jgi:hypothetical protein